jgi:hypothetical protein
MIRVGPGNPGVLAGAMAYSFALVFAHWARKNQSWFLMLFNLGFCALAQKPGHIIAGGGV